MKHVQGGEIAFMGNFEKNFPVHLVPQKLVPLRMKPHGLMQLKIKGEYRHKSNPA
jgi:hypothetical protein